MAVPCVSSWINTWYLIRLVPRTAFRVIFSLFVRLVIFFLFTAVIRHPQWSVGWDYLRSSHRFRIVYYICICLHSCHSRPCQLTTSPGGRSTGRFISAVLRHRLLLGLRSPRDPTHIYSPPLSASSLRLPPSLPCPRRPCVSPTPYPSVPSPPHPNNKRMLPSPIRLYFQLHVFQSFSPCHVPSSSLSSSRSPVLCPFNPVRRLSFYCPFNCCDPLES